MFFLAPSTECDGSWSLTDTDDEKHADETIHTS